MNEHNTPLSQDPQGPQGIQSVEVAGQLLEALAHSPSSLSLKELSDATGIPAGKAHRYLVSLIRSGLARKCGNSTRYEVGPLAIQLGLNGLRQVDVVRQSIDLMLTLRDEINETIILALWTDKGPTAIRFEESHQPVTMNIRPGSIFPMLTSATGQVFSAFLPAHSIQKLIDTELKQAQKTGVTLPCTNENLISFIDSIRKQGIAKVDGGLLPGVSALACPIFDHSGKITAALGVVGRQVELSLDENNEVENALQSTANTLSSMLGYSPDEA